MLYFKTMLLEGDRIWKGGDMSPVSPLSFTTLVHTIEFSLHVIPLLDVELVLHIFA